MKQDGKQVASLLSICFHAGFFSAYFSTVKMEAIYFPETSFDSQRTSDYGTLVMFSLL
jgi:hypothetical protein